MTRVHPRARQKEITYQALGTRLGADISFGTMRYRYLGTILNANNHFWSLIKYDGKFWRAGSLGEDRIVPIISGNVYVTGDYERTTLSVPCSHVYVAIMS